MPSGIWYTSLKPLKVPSHQDGHTPVVFRCTSHRQYYKRSLATLIPETHRLLMPRCPSHTTEFLLLKSPSQESQKSKTKTNVFFTPFSIIPPNSIAYMYIDMSCQKTNLAPSNLLFFHPVSTGSQIKRREYKV